ncbi:hypothetical protein [Eleftheria terrae]|uniref:hypothetical protein n=1 Tax=Eleftheria terrae TaxID=1597781 RepID=UPI00263A4CF6|nr:hypothetical protein [Eleftheria terrae]WKB55686.1 hypothetical protein N7L95_26825 [Eleftheria terrae]
MTIHEYSPFFNEHTALEIKLRESARWVDRLVLCEADHTYSHVPKAASFAAFRARQPAMEQLAAKVDYRWLEAAGLFRPVPPQQIYYDPTRHGRDGFDRWYWELLGGNAAYHNEAVQRSHATRCLAGQVEDEDIVILSDLDEVLDSRHADRIVEETRKRGVITVKLHYSVFYLNLFTASNHGMPDFSYRVYVMTGRFFKTLPFTPDYLRKRGIEGGFLNEIHCLEEPAGFHHSWLDHQRTALDKLKAFEANVADRSIIDRGYIDRCLQDRRLHYLDARLYIDDGKPFLGALQEMDTAGLWATEPAA